MDNNFENVLIRAKKILAVEKDADVAKAIGMTPTAFNNRKRSGSIPFSHYVSWAKAQNVDLNWLLTGEGAFPNKEESINFNEESLSRSNKITIIEHQSLVTRFKNPERGMKNNERLIDIEAASEDLYNQVETYLKGVHDAIKIIKKPGQKKTSLSPNQKAQGD